MALEVWLPWVLIAVALAIGIPLIRQLLPENKPFATAIVVLLVLGGLIPRALVQQFRLPEMLAWIMTAIVMLVGMPYAREHWPPKSR